MIIARESLNLVWFYKLWLACYITYIYHYTIHTAGQRHKGHSIQGIRVNSCW